MKIMSRTTLFVLYHTHSGIGDSHILANGETLCKFYTTSTFEQLRVATVLNTSRDTKCKTCGTYLHKLLDYVQEVNPRGANVTRHLQYYVISNNRGTA